MLQYPTHLENIMFYRIIFGVCVWIIDTEETFELIPSEPLSRKELTGVVLTMNGAVMISKEPEVCL